MEKKDTKELTKAMVALKKGDINALDVIYEKTRRGVFSFVLPVLRDYEKSEDIMQQTYIQIYEKIDQFDDKKNPLNWILTIAKNLALNEINKSNREIATDFSEPLNDDKVFTIDKEFDTPTLNLAAKILSPDEYRIVMLFTVGDYKHREIADMLKMPIGTVTWKYSEAIKKLRKALEGSN